jgi:hypothetical protein
MDIVVKELEKQMNLHEKPKLYSIARLNKAIPVSLVDFYKERKIQIHPRRLFPSQSSLRETLEANVFD